MNHLTLDLKFDATFKVIGQTSRFAMFKEKCDFWLSPGWTCAYWLVMSYNVAWLNATLHGDVMTMMTWSDVLRQEYWQGGHNAGEWVNTQAFPLGNNCRQIVWMHWILVRLHNINSTCMFPSSLYLFYMTVLYFLFVAWKSTDRSTSPYFTQGESESPDRRRKNH